MFLKFIKHSGNLCFYEKFYIRYNQMQIIILKQERPEADLSIFLSKINNFMNFYQLLYFGNIEMYPFILLVRVYILIRINL